MHALAPQMLPQFSHPSHRPPPNNIGAMPTPPVTARKLKRQQFTVTYSEVQEVDDSGRLREVIVIDDSPPPPTLSPATSAHTKFSVSHQPSVLSSSIRTRAQAAAEAQGLSSSSVSTAAGPAPKRRRRDPQESAVRAPPAKKAARGAGAAQTLVQQGSWETRSGAASDEVSRIAGVRTIRVSIKLPDVQGPRPMR